MSLACLDNIVTIRGCSDTQPISGLDLMDAPEISKINLANIATEKDTSGTALAERILSNATIQVRNDLITVLAQNQMLVDVTNRIYETTSFQPTVTKPAEAVERGITLYKAGKSYDSLKTLTIGKIKIWALNAYSNVPVYIHDAGDIQPITSTYEFDLVEGLNEFTVDYKILGKYAHITMDATNVAVASAYLNLCAGCSGRQPNDCGYTQAYYDGRSLNGREGYGIGVDFRCECDYDQLMCNLAKTTLGKIIWMKARVMLMQERLSSNRLNNWVVYGEKDIREYHLPKLEAEYDETWTGFTKSLKQVVNQYSGSCIVCNGIRSVVSV